MTRNCLYNTNNTNNTLSSVIYPYIEEEQTTQWPKEKVQKDKQRSTKQNGDELRCSGRVGSSCSTRITFIMYVQSQKNGKQEIEGFGSKKTKGYAHCSYNRHRSPMPEGGEH